jgi:hypothetical protein
MTFSRAAALLSGLVLALVLAPVSCVRPAVVPPEDAPPPPPHVAWAGARSSASGIQPFPEPAEWERAIRAMSAHYPGSTPVGIWIVGRINSPYTCRLEFPGDGAVFPNVRFEETDRHERYLEAFDRAGIKVFLQVEPAHADMKTLIDLVLGRYGGHPCVIGLGVDVEWHREADQPGRGVAVDDATGRQWESWVKAHDPGYRLFLKHWNPGWLCPAYRGDIVFVDDSQNVESAEALVAEFEAWGRHFRPNPVLFQIGYPRDKPWWSRLAEPPKTLGRAIADRIDQTCGIIWVDFTLRDVLPLR